MLTRQRFLLICYGLMVVLPGKATSLIDFEDLPDTGFFSAGGQNIGSLYPGIMFDPNVTGLSATRFGAYDNTAFPTHSGDVVVWSAFDNDILLTFSSLQFSVSFWYTSLNPLQLTLFDVGNNMIGSIAGNANSDGTTGISSQLSLSSSGIAFATISSAAGQYVIDDLRFDSAPSGVPEPNSGLLLAGALLAIAYTRRRKTRQTWP